MQNGESCHLVLQKNGGIGHALCFKASFHIDEILNDRRRHLEYLILCVILYLVTKFESNPSVLDDVMPKSKMVVVRHFRIVMKSIKTIIIW